MATILSVTTWLELKIEAETTLEELKAIIALAEDKNNHYEVGNAPGCCDPPYRFIGILRSQLKSYEDGNIIFITKVSLPNHLYEFSRCYICGKLLEDDINNHLRAAKLKLFKILGEKELAEYL